MTGTWAFCAIGTPASQGSKRHVGGGRMIESSKALAPWRDTITAAAFGAGPCLDGPLAVRMIFTMPRPKSARKTDLVPYKTPDLSKLARAAEDAITAAGLWADDARVASYDRLAKVWTGYDYSGEDLPVPGVLVGATCITPGLMHWTEMAAVLAETHAAAWANYRRGAA